MPCRILALSHPRPAVTRPLRLTIAVACCLIAGASPASPFRLLSATVDGGGGHAEGARFALEGSIGQPDPGRSSSARFTVDGGFWPATPALPPPAPALVFRNGFEP
jgi:hypothetical protein